MIVGHFHLGLCNSVEITLNFTCIISYNCVTIGPAFTSEENKNVFM